MPDLQTPQGKQEEEPTIQTPKGSESEEELIVPSVEPTAIADGELEPVDTIIIKDGESYRQMKVYSTKRTSLEMSFIKPEMWWDAMQHDEKAELLDYYKIFTDVDLSYLIDKDFSTLDNTDKSQIALLYVRKSSESVEEHECKECGFKSADFDEYKDHMKAHNTPVGSQGEAYMDDIDKVADDGKRDCPHCNYRTKEKEELYSHLGYSHHDELNKVVLNDMAKRSKFGNQKGSHGFKWGESVATESMDCEFCEGKGKVIVEKKGIKECPRCEGEGTVESNQPNQEQISQDVEMPQEVPQEIPVEEEVPLDEFEENEKLWDESEESIAVEEFKEDEHPRASDGKFGSGGGSSDKPKEDKKDVKDITDDDKEYYDGWMNDMKKTIDETGQDLEGSIQLFKDLFKSHIKNGGKGWSKYVDKKVKELRDTKFPLDDWKGKDASGNDITYKKDNDNEEDWKESSDDFKQHIKDGIKKARTKNGGNDEDLSSQKMIFKTKNDVADMSDEELFELANGSQMVQAQSSAYIHKYNKAGDKGLVTNNMKNIPDDYYHDYMDTLRSEIIMDLGLHDKGTDRTPEESLQYNLEKFKTDMEKGKKPHRMLEQDIKDVMKDLEFDQEDEDKAKNMWSSSGNTRVIRGSKKGLNNRYQIMRAIGITGDINSRFGNLSDDDKKRMMTYTTYGGVGYQASESKASEVKSEKSANALLDKMDHGNNAYNIAVFLAKNYGAYPNYEIDFERHNVEDNLGLNVMAFADNENILLDQAIDGIFKFAEINGYSSESKADEDDSCGCKAKSMEAYQSFVSNQLEQLQSKAKSGESVGLLYGQEVETDGRKIKGTLAYAGVSLNDRIYLPEELAKGHGMTLPLLLNHSSISGAEMELDRLDGSMKSSLENGQDFKVGEVTLEWIPEKLTLYYEGEVTDPFFQKEIDDADMSVSLGIYYDSDSPSVCNDKCYTVITGAEFREVSLVYHAGFPIATIEEVESGLKKLGESISKVKSYECIRCKEGGLLEATEQDVTTHPCLSCGEIAWTPMNKSVEAQLLPQLYLPDMTMEGMKIPTVIIQKPEDTNDSA